MNIAFGKLGKSVLFDRSKWPPSLEGASEAPLALINLAKYYPNETFYLVGKSDFSRLKPELRDELFPNNNVVDVWKGFKSNNFEEIQEHPAKFLKDIKIDAGIFYCGPTSGVNMMNKIKKNRDPNQFAKPLSVYVRYVGAVYHWLNISNTPWYAVCNDPRYIPVGGKDIFNMPKFVMSQMSHGKVKHKHIKSYEDQVEVISEYDGFYSGIEKARLIDQPKLDIEKLEKTIDITMILNQAKNAKNNRDKLIHSYVLDHFDNVSVYGAWEEEFYKDKRFKGPKLLRDLESELQATKYTIMFPMQDGWLSPKIYEMVSRGIIPFMAEGYDKQENVEMDKSVSLFLRVADVEDFKKKIAFLNNSDERRLKLLKLLKESMLKDEYYDGTWIAKELMYQASEVAGHENMPCIAGTKPNKVEAFF